MSIDKNGIETWKEEPFYTQPPSWQGLSDDEIDDIAYVTFCGMKKDVQDTHFARAIEQALKEKNT